MCDAVSNNIHPFTPYSVHVGGCLLESYILTSGTREHRRKLKQLIKYVVRTGEDISITDSDEVVRSNRNAFYLHVIHTLHHRGNSVKLQIFYMSLLWRHKGVSRSGIELMSQLNLGMALRTLDEYRERETRRQTEYTRYICALYVLITNICCHRCAIQTSHHTFTER